MSSMRVISFVIPPNFYTWEWDHLKQAISSQSANSQEKHNKNQLRSAELGPYQNNTIMGTAILINGHSVKLLKFRMFDASAIGNS